ncbi:MAG: hypothetical protein E3J72_10135 [Planctomycetota bacterium]|nr:MAG: hypothetical protein E3J72_10135 [Planctomycetota bacterium]
MSVTYEANAKRKTEEFEPAQGYGRDNVLYEQNFDDSSSHTREMPQFLKEEWAHVSPGKLDEWRNLKPIEYRNTSPVYRHLKKLLLDLLPFPEYFKREGISPPNIASKNSALTICWEIYECYGELPIRISATIEEGVFILYKTNNRSLSIEVYNNLEIAALATNEPNGDILHCEDIFNRDIGNAYRAYKG